VTAAGPQFNRTALISTRNFGREDNPLTAR
jgi:hypothetical protein